MDRSNNSRDIPFIKLNKKNGQIFLNKIKQLFKNETILDNKFNKIQENDFILFPLINDEKIIKKLLNSIEKDLEYQLIFNKGVLRKDYKIRSIQEAVKSQIPENYLKFVPRSYDIIGDIAILEFDKKFISIINDPLNFKEIIAKALIQVNKNVKSVFEKKSEIKGLYRLRELKYLFGEKRTQTLHRENDCLFNVDIKNIFFTPRLVFERNRIALMNYKTNEVIVDLFAGVGPFSIQIARMNEVDLLSFDINPNAYNLLLKNIELNKLKGKIIPYNLDIKTLINPSNELGVSLKNKADRIIMNLPEKSLEFLDVACFLLKKSGGIMYIYQISEKPNPIERAIKKVEKKLKKIGYRADEILNSKIVKHFSPKSELVVVDLIVNEI
ncbi:MAG: class I SAM-dependent methyltransferase family protein [Promethearchaeota archaeon]